MEYAHISALTFEGWARAWSWINYSMIPATQLFRESLRERS
jgi:hypothetical protein